MADDNAMFMLEEEVASNGIQVNRKCPIALQSDDGVDSDQVTSHDKSIGAFVIDMSSRSLTNELAELRNYSRREFLSGVCYKTKSSNNQFVQAGEGESSPTQMSSKMSEETVSQEKGKKPEMTASAENGDELVNQKIMVFWPASKPILLCGWKTGTITAFDPINKTHTVTYDDDSVEVVHLEEGKRKSPVDRTPQVQSRIEEEANHPSPATESLKRSEPLKEKHHDTEPNDIVTG